MGPVRDQLAVLNTKVEPLWTALINMGINQATVLHQPDPRRAEYDTLLEKLQDELRGGPLMTVEAYARLQHYLALTKTWEPGDGPRFPCIAGGAYLCRYPARYHGTIQGTAHP